MKALFIRIINMILNSATQANPVGMVVAAGKYTGKKVKEYYTSKGYIRNKKLKDLGL